MRPGLPAWRKLASQNEKYAYRYQNMTSHHGLTKRVAAPIATSEFEIRYGLFKLTKRSDKLFKRFHTSRGFEQYFDYHSISPNCLQFLRSKAEFFVPSTLVAAMFRKKIKVPHDAFHTPKSAARDYRNDHKYRADVHC